MDFKPWIFDSLFDSMCVKNDSAEHRAHEYTKEAP